VLTARTRSALVGWYAANARDLPWRAPDRTPWGVLVSEVMLQQTPVVRVLPVWTDWLLRWPTPTALADAAPGDAIRHWGRLGYPRRALRLHDAALVITEQHGGRVPTTEVELRALPGIGSYTAAAVASFAFGQRAAVVDTNVRRVQARLFTGVGLPRPALSAAEQRLAESLLPPQDDAVATWNVATMELGALVCTARTPRCEHCPVRAECAWLGAGAPPYDGPAHPVQKWHGTDRQVRGQLVAALRADERPLTAAQLSAGSTAPDAQRARCLAGLIEDGLVEPLSRGRYRLPASPGPSANRARRPARSRPSNVDPGSVR
jgi:A/G-specific adenine glycosylase